MVAHRLRRYLDISMTISGASKSLLTELTGSHSPLFDFRRLCANARRTNLLLWKHRYSPQQRLRDATFARPMEFGFQVLSARFHIWNWEANGKHCPDIENHPSSWLSRLFDSQEVSYLIQFTFFRPGPPLLLKAIYSFTRICSLLPMLLMNSHGESERRS